VDAAADSVDRRLMPMRMLMLALQPVCPANRNGALGMTTTTTTTTMTMETVMKMVH
jgi:hypothetical protein